MDFKKIVVIGGGVLGSQIAFQSAFKGFDVTIYMRSEGSITRTKPKLEALHMTYIKTLDFMTTQQGKSPYAFCKGLYDNPETYTVDVANELKEKADLAYENVKLDTNLEECLKDSDLVIESLAEDPKAKIEFYQMAAPLLPEKTVLVTNSSTMLPSTFAQYTGRPEKFLALHFANNIWKGNTAEVMGHAGTDKRYYDEVVEFATAIGMIPLCLHKEQPGYILNTLLVPLLNSGLYLWATDVADVPTIDKTWRLATGAPMGPFQILDMVGVTTAYNIVIMSPEMANPKSVQSIIAKKLKEMIDAGKLGIASGVGFYNYKK